MSPSFSIECLLHRQREVSGLDDVSRGSRNYNREGAGRRSRYRLLGRTARGASRASAGKHCAAQDQQDCQIRN